MTSMIKNTICLNGFHDTFFLGLFPKAEETRVTTNSPVCSLPLATSHLLRPHWFSFEGLRSTLWKHPYKTVQLVSVPWSDTSPLAEFLPSNPKQSVKTRNRIITLSFFCSLLKHRHSRLFYNILSMDRVQGLNRLGRKKHSKIFTRKNTHTHRSSL